MYFFAPPLPPWLTSYHLMGCQHTPDSHGRCLPVSYARTALCTRISCWLRSSHIGSIIHPSKNHLYLVSLFTSGLALPQSQLCHSNQSAVNEKQLLNTRVKHNTAPLGWSRIPMYSVATCPLRCDRSTHKHILLPWNSSIQSSGAQNMQYPGQRKLGSWDRTQSFGPTWSWSCPSALLDFSPARVWWKSPPAPWWPRLHR